MQELNQLKYKKIPENVIKSFFNIKRFNSEDSRIQKEKNDRQYRDYLSKQEDLSREFTRQLQDEFIGYLEDNYILSNKDDIIDFIFNEHPNLQGFLYDVTPLIKEEYSSNKLALMYLCDYECPDLSTLIVEIYCDFSQKPFIQWDTDLRDFSKSLSKYEKFHNIEEEFFMEVLKDASI